MTVFTFWSGTQLSLLNLISIFSFAALHKDITLVIYTTKKQIDLNIKWHSGEHTIYLSQNYSLSSLSQIPNIKIVEIDSGLERYRRLESSVHFADFIRIEKLCEHGGAWIDTDIIFLKPIDELICKSCDQLSVIEYNNVISPGFVYSKSSGGKISLLMEEALRMIKNGSFRNSYQSLGPDLWTKVFLQNREVFKSSNFMPIKSFYPYPYKSLNSFYYLPDDSVIDDEVYGVHWYNGNFTSKYFIECAIFERLKSKSDYTPFDLVFNKLREQIAFDQWFDRLSI